MTILRTVPSGLYCEAGGFYVDPWEPVDLAVVTHAHGDHARRGSGAYLAASAGYPVLRLRLGQSARIETMEYGERRRIGRALVSLHPAGHILGSAQIRVEVDGRVAVVSGDYKIDADPTCTAYEPVRCDHFITETTFGLPVYRWPDPDDVFREIDAWWAGNREDGKTSLLLGYPLGKAQRLLSRMDASVGPVYAHGAVVEMNEAYREAGIRIPPVSILPDGEGGELAGALVVVPPSAGSHPWVRRLGDVSTAFASGWMRVRGGRRRRGLDRGFVLSDHVDWPALITAIEATGAEQIWTVHGYAAQVARWLRERGYEARAIETRAARLDEA